MVADLQWVPVLTEDACPWLQYYRWAFKSGRASMKGRSISGCRSVKGAGTITDYISMNNAGAVHVCGWCDLALNGTTMGA